MMFRIRKLNSNEVSYSRLFGVLAIALLLISCRYSAVRIVREEPTPSDPVTVLSSTDVNAFGRAFLLDVLEASINGVDHEILQIQGDNIVISFGSSTGPYSPTFTGQTISFGGHDFEVLTTPNEYQIDGVFHTLQAHGIYAFYDGQFINRLR